MDKQERLVKLSQKGKKMNTPVSSFSFPGVVRCRIRGSANPRVGEQKAHYRLETVQKIALPLSNTDVCRPSQSASRSSYRHKKRNLNKRIFLIFLPIEIFFLYLKTGISKKATQEKYHPEKSHL